SSAVANSCDRSMGRIEIIGRGDRPAPTFSRRPPGNLNTRSGAGGLLVHEALQHAEGDRAERQEPVVEGAEVELRTQTALGAGAELADLRLADLVGERLPGPGDVAVALALDLDPGDRRVGLQVGDGAVPGPLLVVQAGVDDQTARAPGAVFEL